MNRTLTAVSAILVVLTLQGCGAIMHPRAGEFLEKAKGKTGVETLGNLLTHMEATAQAARAGQEVETHLSTLHDQQYAFYKGLCGVTEAEAKTTSYAKLATLTGELRPIMHRLMHAKEQAAVREALLDLYLKRIDEMKDALATVRA